MTTQNVVTFVLQVAFCIKVPTEGDKNSEWKNKQLNLPYSILTLRRSEQLRLQSNEYLAADYLGMCLEERRKITKSVTQNGLCPTRDLISKYHPHDGDKLSLFGSTRYVRNQRTYTQRHIFNLEWKVTLDIQHNVAGSWPIKWSKNGSHLNLLCDNRRKMFYLETRNTDLYNSLQL